MNILGVIPARYASTRFPGKPLVDIGGKTMIRRVYEQARLANLAKVIVATDDERIATEVSRFGGEYVMTDSTHQSGTDRCAEVARHLPGFDVIVNIQGDEPFIDPQQIDLVASCFEDRQVQIATLIKVIQEEEELFNPHIPKVTIDCQQRAIYFSRHPIPYLRNVEKADWLNSHQFYKHIGIYAYRPAILSSIAGLKPSALEKAESLEQLRWIENGYPIHTRLTTIETIAIDSPDDLLKINF
jgi:3-deoxy-manno-octulosonate cytidylyltransferase (CMP-KDO synthetase)